MPAPERIREVIISYVLRCSTSFIIQVFLVPIRAMWRSLKADNEWSWCVCVPIFSRSCHFCEICWILFGLSCPKSTKCELIWPDELELGDVGAKSLAVMFLRKSPQTLHTIMPKLLPSTRGLIPRAQNQRCSRYGASNLEHTHPRIPIKNHFWLQLWVQNLSQIDHMIIHNLELTSFPSILHLIIPMD